MGDGTGISWTDATWNPVRGCSRVSEGCRHCYAETMAARFCGPGQPYEGLATLRRAKRITGPTGDLTTEVPSRAAWTGEVRMIHEHLADPLRWQRPRRIFVNSMSDLFHEKLTNEEIAAVFGIMAAAPRHTFQVLTKRSTRMREWFEWAGTLDLDQLRWYAVQAMKHTNAHDVDRVRRGKTWPLPNVWLGVSVEYQDAIERVVNLLRSPAAVRFISAEPLLGPLDLGAGSPNTRSLAEDLDWVIAGCESGPGCRACDVEWLRSLRDQCEAAHCAFFLKQAKFATDFVPDPDAKPGDMFDTKIVSSVAQGHGSKNKGRGVIELPYLDGRQHMDFPDARYA